MNVPGLAQLREPGWDVSSHDHEWILQLSVCFCCQFTVDELTSGNDLLTHSILKHIPRDQNEKLNDDTAH